MEGMERKLEDSDTEEKEKRGDWGRVWVEKDEGRERDGEGKCPI